MSDTAVVDRARGGSRRRRRWPRAVAAVVVVLVVLVGAAAYEVRAASSGLELEARDVDATCNAATKLADLEPGAPRDRAWPVDELADVRAAWRSSVTQPRWHLRQTTRGKRGPQRYRLNLTADGDRLLLSETTNDGQQYEAYFGPERSLLHVPGSPVWLDACLPRSIQLIQLVLMRDPQCVERADREGARIVRFVVDSQHELSAADCAAAPPRRIRAEVTMRAGRVVTWTSTLGTDVDRLEFDEAAPVDEPAWWRVPPDWLVAPVL